MDLEVMEKKKMSLGSYKEKKDFRTIENNKAKRSIF